MILKLFIALAGYTATRTVSQGSLVPGPVNRTPLLTRPRRLQWVDTEQADSLIDPEKIYSTRMERATLFPCRCLDKLRRAQEANPDIAPIHTWMEASKERPSWATVSPHSPATKTYWSQWKRLYI